MYMPVLDTNDNRRNMLRSILREQPSCLYLNISGRTNFFANSASCAFLGIGIGLHGRTRHPLSIKPGTCHKICAQTACRCSAYLSAYFISFNFCFTFLVFALIAFMICSTFSGAFSNFSVSLDTFPGMQFPGIARSNTAERRHFSTAKPFPDS